MAPRLQLHQILKTILGTDNVYFQPPNGLKMEYPCIRYERDRARTLFADNKPYNHYKCYQITVIDRNPDSLIPDKVAALPLCVHDRFFTADNLNHDVYTLFF